MPNFNRARRLNSVAVSDIVVMSEAARARRAEGADVISLGIGEPDFNTPDHVNEAAIKAILNHDTRYPPIAGKPELRAAVAAHYDTATAENVIISTGSKYTLLNAFMASINDGDEVIIPSPFWTSYADIVALCGGKAVVLPSKIEDNFQLDPDALRRAMTSKTRWILINTPSNPTGAVMSEAVLKAIGKILDDFPQCWLMSDEIYQHLTYGAVFHSAYDTLPHHRNRMLVTNGVSKAYAMTGWRLGYATGPKALIKAMVDVQAQGTSGASSISQAAALAALTGPQDLLEERRQSFLVRRDLVLSHLSLMEGIETPTPEGAFYTFSCWKKLKGGITPDGTALNTDKDFCQYILAAADTAIIPGSGFAADGHFRISYACPEDDLTRALTRMAKAIAKIKRP
jgi:aspartate aminotransferase